METMKKSYIKGKSFKCLRVIKGAAIESIPAMRKHLQAQADAVPNGIATMTETDTAFEFNNGQFVAKPTQPRETVGRLVCGATFARFDGVRIEYDKMVMGILSTFETENAKYSLQSNPL